MMHDWFCWKVEHGGEEKKFRQQINRREMIEITCTFMLGNVGKISIKLIMSQRDSVRIVIIHHQRCINTVEVEPTPFK